LRTQQTRQRLLASTVIAGAAMLAMAAPAMAQDASDTVEDIVVTGSRIARQDYRSASPVVTTDAADFQATGAVTIESLLNDLPQFTPSIGSTSNNPSNGGQANINLRNLGSNRTLVLVNGRRLVPSNPSGTVDVSIIPIALIKNIEIISGGASAAYGSDALGGVANFILNDSFEGVQFDAQYGETDVGDGVTEAYALTLGGNFADDRGNMVLSLGRSTREVIFNAARPFSSVSGPSTTSPLGSTTLDSTNRPSAGFLAAYFGQAVPVASSLGFNDDGTIFAYTGSVNVRNPAGAGIEYTSPGANYTFNTGPLNYLQLPIDRYNAYAAGTFKINDNAQVYASALFTEYTGDSELAATPASGAATGFRVPSDNPFITGDLRDFLNARPNPDSSFLLNKRFTSLGGRHSEDEYNVFQLTTGIRGEVPKSSWTYDVYASYGRVSNITTQSGNVSRSSVQALLDDEFGGAGDGVDPTTVLCAGGFDPFGITNLSAECIAYIGRAARNQTTVEQRVVEATLQGKAFDLPAGEVRVAFGAQYRQDDYAFLADAGLAASNPITAHINPRTGLPDGGNVGGVEIAGFNASQPLSGGTASKELFGEVLIPVLAGLPFIEQLDVTLGYRYADTSSGGTNAYRADADWSIVSGLRMRGGYNRAVRSPSIGELFAPVNVGFPSIGEADPDGVEGDPCDIGSSYRNGPDAAAVRALCIAQGIDAGSVDDYIFSSNQVAGVSGGNPDLFEETADTYSVGFVYQSQFSSPWLSGVSASIDYYNIVIADSIGFIDVSSQLQGCFNATGENPTFDASNGYCQLFQRDPLSGNIDNTFENNANLGKVKTSGVDLQVDWRFSLADIGAPDWGTLDLNTVVSWLENYEDQVVPGGVYTQREGTIASTFGRTYPEWKSLTSVSWSNGAFGAGVRWRRVGEMDIFQAADGSGVPSKDYFDANASWSVTDAVSLRAGVNNFTDEQPALFSPGVQAGTDPSTYDVLGRRYYVGLTAKF